MLSIDPIRLSRSLAEFASRRQRFVRSLVDSETLEHAFELLPEDYGEELLHELDRGEPEDLLARAASRWLSFLLVEHGNIAGMRRLSQALYREPHALDFPERITLSLAGLRARALSDAPRRDAWLNAFAERAMPLTRARFALWENTTELYEKLRRKPMGAACDPTQVRALAGRVLEATDAAYAELRIHSWPALLSAGLGSDVPGDWPRRIQLRSLAEWFQEGGWLQGLELLAFKPYSALGASSSLRGLREFGQALHDACKSRQLPFVLASEPSGLSSASTGALFALLPFGRSFMERRLGVGRVRARDTLRSLSKVLLVGIRQSALCAMLSTETATGAARYQSSFLEYVPRALGFELSKACAGAVFAGDHSIQHFFGVLLAMQRSLELTETHDEDWFRNPRAIQELRAEFELPPAEIADPKRLEAGLARLTRVVTELV